MAFDYHTWTENPPLDIFQEDKNLGSGRNRSLARLSGELNIPFSLNPAPTPNEFNAGPGFHPWSPDRNLELHYGLEDFQKPCAVGPIPVNLAASSNAYDSIIPGFDFTASEHGSLSFTPYIGSQGPYRAQSWFMNPAHQVNQLPFTPSGFQLNALGQGFNERTPVTEAMNMPLTGGTNHNVQLQAPTPLLGAGLPIPQQALEQPSTADTTPFNNGKQRITCDEEGCTKTFGRAAEFRRHKKTAHSLPKFQCVFFGCKKTFSRADKLSDHLRQGHKHTGLPGYLKQMLS